MRRQSSYRCTMLAIWGVFSPCVRNASRDCPYLFLRALICSVSRFISSCCRATVSTDTARLAANSDRGVTVAAVCVVAAAILSRHPSKNLAFDVTFLVLPFVLVVCSWRAQHQTVPNLLKVFVPFSCRFWLPLRDIRCAKRCLPVFPGLFVLREFRPLPGLRFIFSQLQEQF